MKQHMPDSDFLTALQHLSLEDVERRLAQIDGERATLSLLRRSLVARQRAVVKTQRRSVTSGRYANDWAYSHSF